jgi:hypothetical protein
MEARLGRPERDPEDSGDLRQRQVEIVMEDDERSLLRIEASEASIKLIAVANGRQVVVRGVEWDLGQLDVEPVSAQPSGFVDAGPDEQAVQPGVEAFRVAERGQITPGLDERVLDGVPGLFTIPEDESGGGIQAVNRGACQHGKGVMIASSRSLHEFPLHLAPRGGPADLAVLDEYGEAARPLRSDSLGARSRYDLRNPPSRSRSRPTT